jgi:DNA-binding NarL/FixJ family response regulator
VTTTLLVIEAAEPAFSQAIAEVERTGARVVHGWRHDASVVCTGTVRGATDAAEALLAAVAGAGLIVCAQASRDIVDRLVDDLRHLGPVEHRTAEQTPAPMLTSEEHRLLNALADGKTLSQAAAELHLSRRTADRRLRSAREKLGTTSTAEAIVAYFTLSKKHRESRVGGAGKSS